METTLRADAWFSVANRYATGVSVGEPPRVVTAALLASLQKQLDEQRLAPFGLACTLWYDDGKRCATIALMCAPGQMARPLTSWFQWQHPRWQWANEAPPQLADAARAARLVESSPA